MKLIVAGSRDLSIPADELDRYMTLQMLKPTEIVSGGARGIDTCGEVWAKGKQVKLKRFPADWNQYGKRAGPIRNTQMAEYADALLAFPGAGNGTWDMMSRMRALGKPVYCFSLSRGTWLSEGDWRSAYVAQQVGESDG